MTFATGPLTETRTRPQARVCICVTAAPWARNFDRHAKPQTKIA